MNENKSDLHFQIDRNRTTLLWVCKQIWNWIWFQTVFLSIILDLATQKKQTKELKITW